MKTKMTIERKKEKRKTDNNWYRKKNKVERK